ncbi:MAG: beta-propeller domain-containing protein [Oscillospiraceae bacterium]|nr:beta-propeller domain-containing protein [Oscillospiraceae bacterium]
MKSYEERTEAILKMKEKNDSDRAFKRKRAISLTSLVCVLLVFSIIFPNFEKLSRRSSPIQVSENVSLVSAKNYAEVYKQIKDAKNYYVKNYYNGMLLEEGIARQDAATVKEAVPEADEPTNSSSEKDYSDTNLQTVGVQEADIVKTDGDYIYALTQNGNIYIVSADNGKLEISSKVAAPENSYRDNFYICNDRLIVIARQQYYLGSIDKIKRDNLDYYYIDYDYEYDGYNRTTVAYTYVPQIEIYDISDRTAPKLQSTVNVDGYITDSRMIDEHLYIVSTSYIYNNIDAQDIKTYIPKVVVNDDESYLKAQDIYLDESATSSAYYQLTGINTLDGSVVSSKAVLGWSGTVYASLENIYIASSFSNGTKISKFSIKNGNVDMVACGCVPGNMINQFAMDEYKGNLRVATTYNEPETYRRLNGIYVLNGALDVIGSLDGVAKDESIYSVRFDGDIAYFVTFRQTDPLFAVDLSTPEKPVILSELKIPGYSRYLHPFADGLLFGFGVDGDEFGATGNLKIAMFDVSDPENVIEKHKYVLNNEWYSEALYNHKAVLISAEKNLIGFSTESRYLIFSYDKELGFKAVAEIDLSGSYDSARGLYIDDYFYVVDQKGILAISLGELKETSKVLFEETDEGPVVIIF